VADATPFDEHVERNLDAGAVQQVQDAIDEAGVEFLYYLSVSLNGRVLAKMVPAKHLTRNLEKGVNFHRTAISDLQATRDGVYLGGGAEAPEFTLLPDIDTFRVLPWDTSVGVFLSRIYEPRHTPEIGGQPFAPDCRGNLLRLHDAFRGRTGLELRSGTEPEMTWMSRDDGLDIEVQVRDDASPAYHAGSLETMRPIYQRVVRYGQALGLDMIEGDYEDAGQLELNWMFDRAELTADRLMLYRMACRQVAKEFGVTASFMPKPYAGVMGNGCHHNISLWRGDENVLVEEGRRDIHLSETGRHMLGGILEHARGAMAFVAGTVNSYKRYWDVGLFAPSVVSWGMDNRTCTVRLSTSGRLEYKPADASTNPYLSHAVLLAAIEDGLERQLDPGEPVVGAANEVDNGFESLPLSLGEALEAAAADEVVLGAFPQGLRELYLQLKADEWARFSGAITDWEHRWYREYLP
jgi:glutamine synthetase